uniref:Outer membrane lipoprotein carrier protein LolA n=1 Tax=candidate division WOR-3 bacterium TaxID=2052148 RepID=A0A7V3ZW03_UNCW3
MNYLLIFLLLTTIKNEKEVYKKIKNFYLNLKTITGTFIQRECDQESGLCLEFRGKFYIKKPNYLRLLIEEPEKGLIVADGESLYFYYRQDSLIQKYSINEFNPFLIFFQIMKDTIFPHIEEKGKKYYLLTFSLPYYRLNLQLRKKDFLIEKIKYEWEKRDLEILLYSQKINQNLSDTLFKIKK